MDYVSQLCFPAYMATAGLGEERGVDPAVRERGQLRVDGLPLWRVRKPYTYTPDSLGGDEGSAGRDTDVSPGG